MELQGAQVILSGLGGCALLIFSLSMFFCCVQRWLSLLHYHEMSRSSSQELLFKENEVVQFEVAKPTLIYCTKDIPYQKSHKSRGPMDLNEMEEEVFINESTHQQRSNRPKWKIWKSWESKIQNIIIPVQSQTETQL